MERFGNDLHRVCDPGFRHKSDRQPPLQGLLLHVDGNYAYPLLPLDEYKFTIYAVPFGKLTRAFETGDGYVFIRHPEGEVGHVGWNIPIGDSEFAQAIVDEIPA